MMFRNGTGVVYMLLLLWSLSTSTITKNLNARDNDDHPHFGYAAANTAAARPFNSHMLAVGEWKLNMRGPFWLGVSQIFPLFGPKNRSDATSAIPIQRRPWGTTVPCLLSLAEDGTFILRLQQQSSSLLPSSSTSTQLLRGEWKVFSNPYCMTDRFYDELSLESYPLKQQALKKGNANSNDEDSNNMNQFPSPIQISLHCRMWGHHRNRRYHPKRQQQAAAETTTNNRPLYGKLTHGTMVLIRRKDPSIVKSKDNNTKENGRTSNQPSSNDNTDFHPRHGRRHHGLPMTSLFFMLRQKIHLTIRPVIASFSAVRTCKEPTHEGWIDQHYFGY